jgi:hypothetical protein
MSHKTQISSNESFQVVQAIERLTYTGKGAELSREQKSSFIAGTTSEKRRFDEN